MESEGNEIVIIISTIIIVAITLFVITLFTLFQKRKNNLLKEQEEAKEQFEKEIAETQIEIREQTLRNISWELHDNIGQLLTLAKIQLQNSSPESIKETRETISKSLIEVRALSKLINPDAIKSIKLTDALKLEIDRFNKMNFIKSSLVVNGEFKELDDKSEIIIFRILQEFFSNTIKHSKATSLNVRLDYSKNKLIIIAQDDGVGFDMKKNSNDGIGLMNMKSRAKLINTKINLTSKIDIGTTLKIIYYF
ncbi:sensor histidine kinase [Urechidicola croceus]|uniref:histidine kinase n=1 Tax=Urechidicola croceus TaxID=1850246 RepID=A0A1D8PA03_9FLAO|nr:ATP-binding protein [Urechidicola croceus]AOW21422.1 histidine kinase [Urechidicola croceus]